MIPPAAPFRMSVRGTPATRVSRRSVVGRAVARFGCPADSPASSVKTRHPTVNSRITLMAWASRSRYSGVKDRGDPFSRPLALTTRYGLR
jgi:hypothetical protein